MQHKSEQYCTDRQNEWKAAVVDKRSAKSLETRKINHLVDFLLV